MKIIKGDSIMEEKNDNNVNVVKKMNVCGLISFIFSLIGIIVAGLPCGIIATITGIVGIATFKKEEQKGRGFAIAGLVIGILDVIIMILYIIISVIKAL